MSLEHTSPDPEPTVDAPKDTSLAVQHARGNRVTVIPPDEVVALSELTGRPVSDIIAAIIKRECAMIRVRATSMIDGIGSGTNPYLDYVPSNQRAMLLSERK